MIISFTLSVSEFYIHVREIHTKILFIFYVKLSFFSSENINFLYLTNPVVIIRLLESPLINAVLASKKNYDEKR